MKRADIITAHKIATEFLEDASALLIAFSGDEIKGRGAAADLKRLSLDLSRTLTELRGESARARARREREKTTPFRITEMVLKGYRNEAGDVKITISR